MKMNPIYVLFGIVGIVTFSAAGSAVADTTSTSADLTMSTSVDSEQETFNDSYYSQNYYCATSCDDVTLSSTISSIAFTMASAASSVYSFNYVSGEANYFIISIAYGDSGSTESTLSGATVSLDFLGKTGTGVLTLAQSEVMYVTGTDNIFKIYAGYSVSDDFSFTGLTVTVDGLSGLLSDGTWSSTNSTTYFMSDVLSSSSYYSNVLTCASVPEPASYAAILGAFGLGGAVMLRRKGLRA
jgi:hypothetical protein